MSLFLKKVQVMSQIWLTLLCVFKDLPFSRSRVWVFICNIWFGLRRESAQMPLPCGWSRNFKCLKKKLKNPCLCEGRFIRGRCFFHRSKIHIWLLMGRSFFPELSPLTPFYCYSFWFFFLFKLHIWSSSSMSCCCTLFSWLCDQHRLPSHPAGASLCWCLLEQTMRFSTIVQFVRERYQMLSILDMLRECSEGKLLSYISF